MPRGESRSESPAPAPQPRGEVLVYLRDVHGDSVLNIVKEEVEGAGGSCDLRNKTLACHVPGGAPPAGVPVGMKMSSTEARLLDASLSSGRGVAGVPEKHRDDILNHIRSF